MKQSGPVAVLPCQLAVLLLLVSSPSSGGVEITRCCPGLQVLSEDVNTCLDSPQDSQQTFMFPPKIYSVEAGEYVNETFVVRNTSVPRCEEGEILTRLVSDALTEDSFVLLSEESSLFLPADTSTHSAYCLESVLGPEAGTAALVCVADPALQCQHTVCVSSCCPEKMLVDLEQGDCVYSHNYSLLPPFRDGAAPQHYLMVTGEPQCDVHVYNQEEFLLGDDGQLEIDHHSLNISQYCIQDIQQGDDTALIAKVCYQGDEQQRARLEIISRKLTPALLIISEIFLLLTFVLHVIVPEFRKQMFGGWLCPQLNGQLRIFYLTTIR